MVHLFLSEPVWNNVEHDDSSKLRKSLLCELDSAIQMLLISVARGEARLWLCESISKIDSISRDDQCELFMKFLRSKSKHQLASQLLRLIFNERPDKAGSVISKKSYTLKKFFEGNPTRILKWFSNFGIEQGKGTKALTQFAFVNRDICWEELEWKGKHGQSPAVVATKPHYFLDLDVQRTVENFLDNVPEFWSSGEFSDSLKDGEILSVDRKYFLDYFTDLMFEEDSRDVWEVVNEFLTEESFSCLCHALLITLEEQDLHRFLESICKIIQPKIDVTEPKGMLEVILSKCNDRGSFDEISFLNVVLMKKREILRLLRDEGNDEAKAKIKGIVTQICDIPDSENGLAPLIKECFKAKNVEAVRLLVLQSWVLFNRILEECQAPESWESLFAKNKITFRISNSYALLDTEESDSELGCRRSNRDKHGKKSRKKRKRKSDLEDRFVDKFHDMFAATDDGLGTKLNDQSWLLSIDGYSTTWNNADLPEHLSHHSLSTWMRWVLEKRVE